MLEVVTVGEDSRGREITSCVIVPYDLPESEQRPQARPKQPPASVWTALRILKKEIEENPQVPPASSEMPTGLKAATTKEAFRARFMREAANENDESKARAFSRALVGLQTYNLMGAFEDWLWLTSS